MKSFYILSLAFGLISWAHAQDTPPDAEQIQKAIDEFNRSRKTKENEVTVVLPPPGQPATPPAETEDAAPRAVAVEEESDTDDKKKKPVLVSGKPPEPKEEEGDAEDESPDPVDPFAEEPKPEEKQPEEIIIPETPEPSTVRVESIRSGTGAIDPKNIEIKSNFPTKALIQPPAGWKLESTEQAPAFTRQVEIKPGTFISLQITPHVLSPESDGANIFSVTEPGYDHQKGYQQDQTVANILESSITQLETDSMKMGSALSELHRLLASLPKPETPVSNTPPSSKP